MDGEVIGVNSQIATSTGDYNGIGFALPSDEASNVYWPDRHERHVSDAAIWVHILSRSKPEFAKVYGLNDAEGAIVTDIRDKQSPAAVAACRSAT